MKVIAAKNIGFCFGVERAIEIARKEVEDGGTVYTYGELIHNLTVIDELRRQPCHNTLPWRSATGDKKVPRIGALCC